MSVRSSTSCALLHRRKSPLLEAKAEGEEGEMVEKKLLTANFGNEQARQIATYEKLGGYKALKKALGMKREDIIEEVKKSSLRGRGGAGFPCGVKWGFVPKDAETVYLVVNADEGEPGTYKDRWLMYWDPHRLIEGCCISGYAIGAHHTYIYIRGELYKEAAILDEAVKQAYQKGILGKSMAGSGWQMEMAVHRGAGAYICGEETSLLNSLEGRRGYPRLKPPFPAIKGAFGKPTVVNNVETLMSVPAIIEIGGDEYAKLGCPGEGGQRAVAISGHVKNRASTRSPVANRSRRSSRKTPAGCEIPKSRSRA
jgi:NADH-quinone oxidoreductase subunit F